MNYGCFLTSAAAKSIIA